MIKFRQGDNDHIWFSEDDNWAIIKRFYVGDFLLYKKDDREIFEWCERYFDGWDDIIKYLENKQNEII